MEGLGVFIFLAAGAVALFSFLSVAAWSEARKSERVELERLALYRKLAESPGPSVELVLARLREEDARQDERQRQKYLISQANTQANTPDARQTGVILIAVGIGLGIFFFFVGPDSGWWSIGILVVLVGLVVTAFSFVKKPAGP